MASRPVYPHTHLSVTTEEGRDAESESAPEGLVEVINQGGQTTEQGKFGSNGADVLRKERSRTYMSLEIYTTLYINYTSTK